MLPEARAASSNRPPPRATAGAGCHRPYVTCEQCRSIDPDEPRPACGGARAGASRGAGCPRTCRPVRNTTCQLVLELLWRRLRRRWRTLRHRAQRRGGPKRWAAGSGRRRRTHRLPLGEPGCGAATCCRRSPPCGGRRWRAERRPRRRPDAGRRRRAARRGGQISLFHRLNAVRARADAACVAAGSVRRRAAPARGPAHTARRGLVYRLQPWPTTRRRGPAQARRARAWPSAAT